MKNRRQIMLLSAILFAGMLFRPACLLAERTPLVPDPLYVEIAERCAWRFPREHLTYSFLDNLISSRTWTNYITSLDYDRVYFMQSDIDEFKAYEFELDDKLSSGDISPAFKIYERFLDRVRERCQYTEKLLAGGFNLEQDENYVWKRKSADWPKDVAEYNEIWRKKIKNEYVQRVVSMKLAEDVGEKTNQTVAVTYGPETNAILAEQTNQPVVVTNAPPVNQGQDKQEDEDAANDADKEVLDEYKNMTPEEFIGKRYRQFLTTLEDNDAEWVMEKYLSDFARAYDPHSSFMSYRSLADFNIEMKLSLDGIGALLKTEDGIVVVEQIMPGGPAARDKRLKARDKIIAVGQGDDPPESIIHWPLQKTVGRIRGKKGTKVILTVIPVSDPTTTRQIDLFRDEVKLEDQAAKLKIKEAAGVDGVKRKLGVIVLPAFYANMEEKSESSPEYKSCALDVEKLLAEAVGKGVEGILLDLRNDGGGSLTEAVKMTGLFIETGPTVQVKERQMIPLVDDDPGIAYGGPLVVLVDRRSASASEIVAGALQDYGRAIIAGDSKTHGKGTVQTISKLGYSDTLGRIKITCSMFYRITGSSTQLKGVVPDVVVPSPYDYMEFGEEVLSNPIPWTEDQPAAYKPVTNLTSVIVMLKENSEKRRKSDPRFEKYTKLLAHIADIAKKDEVSLNLNERLKQAKEEKELSDVENSIVDVSEEDMNDDVGDKKEGENKKNDVVLDEGLNILADFVSVSGYDTSYTVNRAEPEKRNMFQSVVKWFREVL